MQQLPLSFDVAPPPAAAPPRRQRELLAAGEVIGYELRRARRRTIGFVVDRGRLVVSAPRWVGIAEIEAALREKSGWVVRKLAESRERERCLDAARIDWCDGARLPFLGRPVTLRVQGSAASGAALFDAATATLQLALPHAAEPAQIRDAARTWLQRQARRLFEQRCAEYAPRLGVRMTRLALSSAATRWGSACADGSIRLSWRLIHFGLPVIDYVVVHELAHLREMNHSARFWAIVRSVLPGFEAARDALRDPLLPSFD
jgi:predicted metal-dependent hydrolase